MTNRYSVQLIMSKEYTNYLKGVAILMMLFLHLFQHLNWDATLICLFHVGDVPLVYYITRLCNPVPFFLILSGYGLYAVYTKLGGVKPWKRVSNLYIHLWLIYLLMVPLACYVKPELYPGKVTTLIMNATSWHCSYIGEQWFFLPYIILMIASKWIFYIFDKKNTYWLVGILVVIWMFTVYILKRFDNETLSNNMLFYNVFLAVYMVPSFTLGYMANRFSWISKVKIKFAEFGRIQIFYSVMALFALCLFRCFIPNSSIAPFFAIIFVLLFTQIPIGRYVGIVLTYLGKHSMNVWLIHTWFSTRLFHDFFYEQLRYPLFIYVTLLAISLVISHIVEWLYRPMASIVQ